MLNGNDTTNGSLVTDDDKTLDIKVLNNGVKLLGEAVVPGASLLLEKEVGAGLLMGGLGVLGSAALGSTFGPLGYILTRYGASAISFSQSLKNPPPTDKKAIEGVSEAVKANTQVQAEILREIKTVASAVPPAFAPAINRGFATAQPVAGTVDFAGELLRLLQQMNDRLETMDGRLKSMENVRPASERRSGGRRSNRA